MGVFTVLLSKLCATVHTLNLFSTDKDLFRESYKNLKVNQTRAVLLQVHNMSNAIWLYADTIKCRVQECVIHKVQFSGG